MKFLTPYLETISHKFENHEGQRSRSNFEAQLKGKLFNDFGEEKEKILRFTLKKIRSTILENYQSCSCGI